MQMKILRLTTLLDFGGQERKYLSFTMHPELLQHSYEFAAIGFGGNAEKILRERGFEVHVLNRNFSIRNLSNLWKVYKLIKKIKPDLVHTAAAEANFFGILAARLAGVKVIAEEIGIPNHSKIARRVFKLVYKFASKVICVSKSVKDFLVQIGEIPEDKGVVIYNPVTYPPMYPETVKDQFTYVYVGRLEKVKNVDFLIKAFSRANLQDSKLVIVGDGRERNTLENLVVELNLESNVEFIGFSSQPSEYVNNADVFVLPSLSEGFGIAAVEAMFAKKPVLCTSVGGIPEFVSHNSNGWLFNPTKLEELSSLLKSIHALSQEELKHIGQEGYDTVIEKFTVENYIKNLEEQYGKN